MLSGMIYCGLRFLPCRLPTQSKPQGLANIIKSTSETVGRERFYARAQATATTLFLLQKLMTLISVMGDIEIKLATMQEKN
jgi:hypothetical protein